MCIMAFSFGESLGKGLSIRLSSLLSGGVFIYMYSWYVITGIDLVLMIHELSHNQTRNEYWNLGIKGVASNKSLIKQVVSFLCFIDPPPPNYNETVSSVEKGPKEYPGVLEMQAIMVIIEGTALMFGYLTSIAGNY
mmetsp:Transcript_18592/g.33597  ORF Transcript_18592/g.33597 Transcript_18592/m.33597 type:complete len:136 (-) Transcript_18592:345-752(-)